VGIDGLYFGHQECACNEPHKKFVGVLKQKKKQKKSKKKQDFFRLAGTSFWKWHNLFAKMLVRSEGFVLDKALPWLAN
jgi:hypothetical protein